MDRDDVKFTIETVVLKTDGSGGREFYVLARANGFEGSGSAIFLGLAFEKAYEDLTAKILEGTSAE